MQALAAAALGWCAALPCRCLGDDAPAAAAAPAKPPPTLDVWEIDVAGNSVLTAADIVDAVRPYTGPRRTLDDIDRAREALEQLYRDRGFKSVAVTIPRQKVRDGVVRLQVVEGRVEHLNVVGSRYHSLDRIKEQTPALAEGSVPDFGQLQKQMVDLNRQPDQRVTPALRAGSAPGTIDVDLAVEDHLPLHGSVELNNQRSQNTAELRTTGSLSYDNLWQLGHSFSVSYQTSPQNQANSRVLFASYLARFGASPWSLLLNGIKSDSNVAVIGGSDVLGKGQTVVLRAFLNLPAGADLFPSLYFGVDYKHVETFVSVGQAGSGSAHGAGSAVVMTPITYYPFSIGLNGAARLGESVMQADMSVNFAVPEFGSNSREFDNSRFDARGQQFYFKENLSYLLGLPFGTQAVVRLASQLAGEPLVSTEQFSAGGAESVRGYLEAEVIGDYGCTGSLELRSPMLADRWLPGDWARSFDELRLFTFFDGGRVLLRRALPGSASDIGLASAGAGLNLKMFGKVDGTLDWAEPLYNASATRRWNSRVLFRVAGSF